MGVELFDADHSKCASEEESAVYHSRHSFRWKPGTAELNGCGSSVSFLLGWKSISGPYFWGEDRLSPTVPHTGLCAEPKCR